MKTNTRSKSTRLSVDETDEFFKQPADPIMMDRMREVVLTFFEQ
jgi:hypothetical protein